MNPLTHFKKIPILPLLIALALVAWAAGAARAAISDFNGDGHPDFGASEGQHASNSDLVSEQQRFHQRRVRPDSYLAGGF